MKMDPRSANDLVELVHAWAEAKPDEVAYRFLVDGEPDGRVDVLTYGQVAGRARAIAALLRAAGAAGERALLLYPPGLDFVAAFFGCLAAGVVAVPAYPPDPARLDTTLPRLQAIASDSGARFVLTIGAFQDMAAALGPIAPDLAALRWMATDAAPDAPAEDAPRRRFAPGDLAFLQYTSGSTSAPKGVMITHGNLMANSAAIYDLAEHGRAGSVYVCWVPSYHDMGLIGGIVQPMFAGIPGVLLSPIAFLQRPARWLQAISRYRGTTSPFPNFALDLCVKKISPEEIRALDLRSWRLACNGAEPVRAESLARFAEAFAPAGFAKDAHYPAFGLAESTVIVTGGSLGAPVREASVDRDALLRGEIAAPVAGRGRSLVGCGRALVEHELAIVDPATYARLGDDRLGEIWFRGPSVAAGYWANEEATRETFGARLASGEGPFLRTGDLGFLRDGHLFVTGRAKDLVIVRGKNHYPQDVERTVERAHPAVRPGCVAAFAVDAEGGEEGLAVVIEARAGGADLEGLVAAVREAIVAEHEIAPVRVAVIAPGALPKTSSGKLRRGECRRALEAGALATSHVWTAPPPSEPAAPVLDGAALRALPLEARAAALEGYLAARVADALGLSPAQIDRTAPLRDLGLDSIAAVSLQGDLDRELGLSLALGALLQGAGGLRDIALDLAAQLSPRAVAAPDAPPDALADEDVRAMLVALLEQEGRAEPASGAP